MIVNCSVVKLLSWVKLIPLKPRACWAPSGPADGMEEVLAAQPYRRVIAEPLTRISAGLLRTTPLPEEPADEAECRSARVQPARAVTLPAERRTRLRLERPKLGMRLFLVSARGTIDCLQSSPLALPNFYDAGQQSRTTLARMETLR